MKVCVLGAGSFGTSIANVLAHNGHTTFLWGREKALIEDIQTKFVNTLYLPDFNLDPNIIATTSLEDTRDCDITFIAIPTQYIRSTIKEYNITITSPIVVNLSKGVEQRTLMTGSQILEEVADVSSDRFCVLTGPSHAEEVVRSIPTAVVVASKNLEIAQTVQRALMNAFFRVYTTSDVVGCELSGSLKNIIAIAAGIIDGLQLGDNTKAAMFTRGIAEISRLGVARGAEMSTFFGLAGIGDLMVTCNSVHSRNRFVGEQIGKGKRLSDILAGMKSVAEGVITTAAAYDMSKNYNVEMPITEQIHQILFDYKDPMKAMFDLMSRSSKSEVWF